MSGKKAKYLRNMLSGSIGFDIKKSNPITKKIYRRLKKRYNSLNRNEKSKINIEDYE